MKNKYKIIIILSTIFLSFIVVFPLNGLLAKHQCESNGGQWGWGMGSSYCEGATVEVIPVLHFG